MTAFRAAFPIALSPDASYASASARAAIAWLYPLPPPPPTTVVADATVRGLLPDEVIQRLGDRLLVGLALLRVSGAKEREEPEARHADSGLLAHLATPAPYLPVARLGLVARQPPEPGVDGRPDLFR